MPRQVAQPELATHGRVTVRAVLLGLALLPLNSFWLVQMEMGRSGGPYPTTFSLFGNVVMWLVMLAGLNALLRRVRPRWAWSSAELLTCYVMLCLGSAIASVDFLDVLVPMLGHPIRFATDSNQWATTIQPHLPPGFAVRDAAALRGWYEGHSSLYLPEHLRAWAPPVVLWSAFIFVLLGVMLCMAVLVRRRWTDHERLAYPLLAVPLAIADERGEVWRTPALWQGILIGGGVTLLNGIAYLVPAVPALPVKARDLGLLVTNLPWRAIGWTPASMYPFAVGLGFLLPVDLLFSCWFFYLWWKVEKVVGASLGLTGAIPRFPYVEEQCAGAYLAVALAALWTGRRYLADVWRDAVGSRPMGGVEEPLSYRVAVAGLVGGIALLVWFFVWAGLPWVWALVALGLYYLIVLACARMRAELAPPAHDLHNAGPERLLTTFFGPGTFTPRQLTVLTYFYWFNRAYRSIPVAHQLEAFKLAEREGFAPRRLVAPMVLAVVVGTFTAFWAHLDLAYRWGAASKMAPHMVYFGWEAFNRLSSWLTQPVRPDVPASLALFAGLGQALLLQTVRLRWAGWPFHPLGLAVSGSYSTSMIWLPLLVSWIIKSQLMRYGGIRAYRRARPFFVGLILGDYLVGCAWPLYGWLAGVPTYSFQQ